MGDRIGDKREDFLSDLTACHGTAPVMSSGAIESPKQPRVEVTRAQVSFDGRKIRILTIVDVFSKLSPAIDVRFRYTGIDVVATLNRVTGIYGIPQTIRVDNGPEFVSRALDLWAYQHGIVLDFSRPGKLTDNSFVEAFNGKVRAECIDQNWFLSLADARLKCEAFRHEYNCERPHSSIGHKTPAEFMKSIGPPSQPMGS